jgi:hypothetical protein
MSERICDQMRRAIDKSFVGELSDRHRDRLDAHLAACESCRAYYDRLGVADRALSGTELLSVAANDRIAAKVSGRVVPKPARSWSSWLLVPAGGLAAILAVVIVRGPEPDDGYRARGVSGAEQGFLGRAPGLSLFCVAGKETIRGSVRAVEKGDPPVLRCGLGDELQLAYSTPSEGLLSLVVSGATESGDTYWYAPTNPEDPNLVLATDKRDEPLPFSTRLEVKHVRGRVDVTARFFKGPGREAPVSVLRARLVVE